MVVETLDIDHPRASSGWGTEIVAWALVIIAVALVPFWLWSYRGSWAASSGPGRIIHVVARNDGNKAPGMWLVQKGKEWNYRATGRHEKGIRVRKGEWVTLRVTSIDATHTLSIPDLGIEEVVDPGKITKITFRADKEGVFPFQCLSFCRFGHEKMTGRLIVLPSQDRSAASGWVRGSQR